MCRDSKSSSVPNGSVEVSHGAWQVYHAVSPKGRELFTGKLVERASCGFQFCYPERAATKELDSCTMKLAVPIDAITMDDD